MKICVQDPYLNDYSLHEEILLASIGATYGAGIFAFVTKGGVDLLLNDDVFLEFIKASKFDLIIGTDEITNTQTIERLIELTRENINLNVLVFLNDKQNSLFHPKFCWFKINEVGKLIIGSGNLTLGGLRKNWEAFSILDFDKQQINSFEQQMASWQAENSKFLKRLEDPTVIERVKRNVFQSKKSTVEPEEGIGDQVTKEDIVDDLDISEWSYNIDSPVLVAEIPNGGTRWNQANFDKRSFTTFFGATPGDNSLRVLFRGINTANELLDIESRNSVSVKSHNWRFELDLAKNKDYPSKGRPIGIFIKVSIRMFLYMLLMPDDDYFDQIYLLLDSIETETIRRCQVSVEVLNEFSPDLPILNLLIKE